MSLDLDWHRNTLFRHTSYEQPAVCGR